jgi:signal transduction histidine kinase/FixJ family two-component response regulator/HPt (histidine-containing phosphotransfer) domain-containing protein
MKKIPVQVKIGSLMLLAVAILSATGYLSYMNLSSIVSSIKVDMKPELRLYSIRDISLDLEKAQNSIRIYTITNDTLDLHPYYTIISNIDAKVSRLREECINDSLLPEQIDTIGRLIEENIVIWNKLLYLNNNKNVVEYMNILSDRLRAEAENAKKTERNIIKRIFSRSNKPEFNQAEILTDLQVIKQQDSITKKNLITRESQLALTGNEIKERFYDLINKIENEISRLIEAKAEAADKLARKTYIWLAMFSMSGTLLAILVMFIIIRFVRKTKLSSLALENSKDQAQKLAAAKEMFMANMSHEIRTPVTAISGFTEQLLQETFDENTTRSLKIIKSSSDHLKNIINDILDFSKLQSDKLELEKVHFSIRLLLEDVYGLFEKQSQRNNTVLSFSLSPDTPPVLLGDPYRLKQIIINLVSNSVKFTHDGKVHFSVKSSKSQSGEIELVMEFTDTGIGIDEDKINYVFEDFTQGEMSTSRKYGGTGLGLSIVKKLIDLHGGTISLSSQKNRGTQIICTIPYSRGEENLVKPDLEPALYIPEGVRNLKILIVDDEEYNRLLFKAILGRWQIKFTEAESGTEALKLLKTDRYDLVFMDARMAVMDGLEVTRIIRNEMKISEAEMSVICISAAAGNEELKKYIDAGMDAFLPKPFTEKMLLNIILSVVKTSPTVNTSKTKDKAKEEIPGTHIIYLDNLYHISGGDEQFVKQMLISFTNSTERGLSDMSDAVRSDHQEQVADLAHKLFPPARHIGAVELCNLLKKIEESIHNGLDATTVEKLITESVKEFEAVNELIKEQIAKIG